MDLILRGDFGIIFAPTKEVEKRQLRKCLNKSARLKLNLRSSKVAKSKKKTVVAGGEKHVVYKKTTERGEGKKGNIMVNHPTKDKGKWDTIDLTKEAKAKTVAQGVAATKKWHKQNPYPKKK